MEYRESSPPPSLAAHVMRLWSLTVPAETEPFLHTVYPDGTVNLVAMQRGTHAHLTLQGPHVLATHVPIEPGDRYWGVRCWPDAGGRLFGIDPIELRDALRPAAPLIVDADAIVRALVRQDDASVWSRSLAERVTAAAPIDVLARRAVLAIIGEDGRIPLEALASRIGLGPRQLQRRFVAATGLTIKAYARVRRLRATMGELLEDVPAQWARVAAVHGFADQAHLAREFRALAGMTPRDVSAYVRRFRHEGVAL